jgi:hypothetical protein
MVGITRRKIILNIFFLIKGLFPLSIDRKLASSASSAADIGQFWLGEGNPEYYQNHVQNNNSIALIISQRTVKGTVSCDSIKDGGP